MQNTADRLELKFTNSADGQMPALQLMLRYIVSCLPACPGDIVFRSQVIITELLTNAIKHAGVTSTLFYIEAGPDKIIIEKTDQGPPLELKGIDGPVACQHIGQDLLISADPLNSLYATFLADNRIIFRCKENMINDIFPVDLMMEHFGMLIISRSANEFTYRYDEATRSNIFRAVIELQDC